MENPTKGFFDAHPRLRATYAVGQMATTILVAVASIMIGIASIYLANRGIEQAERALPVSVAVNVDNLHLTPGQWVIKATNSGGPVERFRMEALALFEVCEMHVGPVSWAPSPPPSVDQVSTMKSPQSTTPAARWWPSTRGAVATRATSPRRS